MGLFSMIFGGAENRKFLREARAAVVKINSLEREYSRLEEYRLPEITAELKRALARGEPADSVMPRAFALVKNAARRLCGREIQVCSLPVKWNMVHFDVQLIAGLALWKNMVAEVATGEGKTLAATLPAFMNSLYGRGCHIATVNEYLARRDSQWMGALYNMLGVSCACVYADQSADEKRLAYAADITYGTSSEFGFDYLRDNSMTASAAEKVQRGFFYALVDEADSILIDEARTPLIISGDDEDSGDPFTPLLGTVEKITAAQNALCLSLMSDFKKSAASGAPDYSKLYQVYCGAPRNKAFVVAMQNPAYRAKLEELKTNYCADCNKVEAHALKGELFYVVDELSKTAAFTEKGQNFLAKSGGKFTVPDIEFETAKINASKMPEALKARELSRVRSEYAEVSRRIFALNTLLQAYALYERNVDYLVKDSKVEIIDQNTGRVLEGRRWENGLHQAVEAKERVAMESETATYATIGLQNYFKLYPNLAGMTATAMSEADEFREIYAMKAVKIPPNKPCIRRELPDLVFPTRREKFNAIEREVHAAKQRGQPVLVITDSVEESEVLSRMLQMRGIKHAKLNAVNDEQEARIIARAGEMGTITISTNMAGRGTDIKLGDGVEALGGLFVIGTQHSASVRVDRQLVGRCARQGDRGMSRFIISFEDSLFRMYADVSALKRRMKSRYSEGTGFVIERLGRIVEAAQKKAQGYNFEARKDLLKLDMPMNQQRAIVYSMRDEILSAQSPAEVLRTSLARWFAELVKAHFGRGSSGETSEPPAEFAAALAPVFDFRVPDDIAGGRDADLVCAKLDSSLDGALENPIFKDAEFVRSLMLHHIDAAFREHLLRLDYLREAIYLRSYGQRDPFQEFAFEAYNSFREFYAAYCGALAAAVFSSRGATAGGTPSPEVSVSAPRLRRRQGR